MTSRFFVYRSAQLYPIVIYPRFDLESLFLKYHSSQGKCVIGYSITVLRDRFSYLVHYFYLYLPDNDAQILFYRVKP